MALTTCRIMGAILVIARLDRLSRDVAMIARLMESGVDFVAADFPHANKFTIHVLAAVAEYKSKIQSERMKAVLGALKQRGVKVGNTKRDQTRRFPLGWQTDLQFTFWWLWPSTRRVLSPNERRRHLPLRRPGAESSAIPIQRRAGSLTSPERRGRERSARDQRSGRWIFSRFFVS